MADRTSIEWTDASWTPVKGCSRASHGCINCYAEIMAARFSQPGMWGEGLAQIVTTPSGKDHRWTGVTRFDANELAQPLRWKKARRIFVCSTSDLFHESVPDDWIDQCFAIMAMCPQHTFQVLTKRADRMRRYLSAPDQARRVSDIVNAWPAAAIGHGNEFTADVRLLAGEPLPNVWLGISAEDQKHYDERWSVLAKVPAAVRWVSAEPLLGHLDILAHAALPDWVVAGGESGPGARPMHPDWARSLRDQCAVEGIAFLFKQWGAWREWDDGSGNPETEEIENQSETADMIYISAIRPAFITFDGRTFSRDQLPEEVPCRLVECVGKKVAGRLLDGALHDAMPGAAL